MTEEIVNTEYLSNGGMVLSIKTIITDLPFAEFQKGIVRDLIAREMYKAISTSPTKLAIVKIEETSIKHYSASLGDAEEFWIIVRMKV